MISQRDFMARNRHRMALLAVLGAISVALVTEHSGLGTAELMDEGMGAVASMCLAVFDAGVLLLGGAALFALARRFGVAPRELGSRSIVLPSAPAPLPPWVRAGPPQLQVFRR